MIVETENKKVKCNCGDWNCGGYQYKKVFKKLKQENWKEWFRIEVSNLFLEDSWFKLPKGFIRVKDLASLCKDSSIYYIWYLVPFVKLFYFLNKIYWFPAKFLYKKGHLKVKEEESCHWFWFSRIRFKKLKLKNK